jgi:hypothetical protein
VTEETPTAPDRPAAARSFEDRVDAVLERVAPALKKAGFKRAKRIFRREVETKGAQNAKAIQVVEVQFSSTSGGEGLLDVFFGVYWKDFVPILTPWKTKPPAAPREVDGQVRVPPESLGAEGDARRWRVGQVADDEIAAKLEKTILERGIPMMEKAVELSSLARGEVAGADPFLVILAQARLGQKDAAQASLAKLAAERPKEYIVVASFAGRLKLKTPPKPAG